MSVKPVEKKHSITEAIFGIVLDRNITEIEANGVVKSEELNDELPRIERPQSFQFIVGDIPPPIMPVTLFRDSYSKRGKIEWRLALSENVIHVNCLVYSQWDNIWPEALKVFEMAERAGAASPDNKVSALYLQIINNFSAPEYADPKSCIRPNTKYLPATVMEAGHFNFGTQLFPPLNRPNDGIIRTNLSVDYGDDPQQGFKTLKSSTLIQTHTSRLTLGDYLKQTAASDFEELRQKNRRIMRELLTAPTLERIGLGEQDDK